MADVNPRLRLTEMTIRSRVECEENAFHIVNKLIDGCVDGQYLSECGKRISQENYDDIVEERAITMLCGYPVCDQNLPNVPRKKYHISTKTNKVYDISERKNFCSNQCFKASKFFKQQIPDSPLWTRDGESIDIIISPHKTVHGLVGEEIIGERPKAMLQKDLEELNEMDKKFESMNISNSKSKSPKQTECCKKKTNANRSEEIHSHSKEDITMPEIVCDKSDRSPTVSEKDNVCFEEIHKNFDNLDLEDSKTGLGVSDFHQRDEMNSVATSSSSSKSSSPCVPGDKSSCTTVKDLHSQSLSKLEQLQKLLHQRKNILSGMVDLQDSKKEVKSSKDQLHEKSDSLDVKVDNSGDDVTEKLAQPVENKPSEKPHKRKSMPSTSPLSPLEVICKVLKTWVSVNTIEYLKLKTSPDSIEPLSINTSDLQSQVDYVKLCRRLDDREKQLSDVLEEGIAETTEDRKDLKVAPNYQALKEEAEQFQLKVTEFITGKRPKDQPPKKIDATEDAFIPTVDAYDQLQIRAKIVLERLDRSLPDLLVPMCLSVQDVSSFIRELVYTFRLERDTIIFKPAEWTLVSLLLLKMLSSKVKLVDKAFEKDSSIRHFNVLLMGIKHTMEDLEVFTRELLSNTTEEDVD